MTNEELIKKYVNEKDWETAFYKLNKNIPVQYIIGTVDFYGYEFIVNESVLIPRFETETLIEKTIKYIKEKEFKYLTLADLGCGTGCIGITLEKELHCKVTCFDISEKALEVAKENKVKLNADIKLIKHDILEKIPGKYNVLISNPPYIAYSEKIPSIVKDNEPNIALFAENDGLLFYDQILSYAKDVIEEKFIIAFEIGCTQGENIIKIAETYFKKTQIKLEQDLCGKDRYIFIFSE